MGVSDREVVVVLAAVAGVLGVVTVVSSKFASLVGWGLVALSAAILVVEGVF